MLVLCFFMHLLSAKRRILLFTRVHCMQSGCFPFRSECKVGVLFFLNGKRALCFFATGSSFLRERFVPQTLC